MLFGPSGSGKTTFINVLSGIVKPLHGLIKVGNATFFDSENKINLESNFNLPGYLKLDFGFTLVENKGHSLKSDLFPSRSLDLYYSKPLFLSKDFSFNPGIGISNDRLSFSWDLAMSILSSERSIPVTSKPFLFR